MKEELIQLGQSMKAKERSPKAIYSALSGKAPDKETLNEALEIVFTDDNKKQHKNPEHVKALLKANNNRDINISKGLVSFFGARMLGYVYPFVYLGTKGIIGWFIFTSYRKYIEYDRLTSEVKQELEEL